jgi:hypothetical protein
VSFDPVRLHAPPPEGITADWLNSALLEWVGSPPLRALADASGWTWPEEDDLGALLTKLVSLSADWDYRAQRERNFIESDPAEVNGRVIPDDLVTAAARALGMVDATPAPPGRFTGVLVLSGLVSACVNRTRRSAELLRDGLDARSVVVLAGHRALAGKEPDQARELGYGELFDEADAAVAAARDAFGLAQPAHVEVSCPLPALWTDELWGASGRYHWPEAGGRPPVEVLVVPSADPHHRRTTVPDQLRYWAAQAGLGARDRVLVVTTQIYAPFHQLEGLRMLGLEHGCAVTCCGVDTQTAFLPMNGFNGRSYLQEIRSALRAASSLLAAARQRGH